MKAIKTLMLSITLMTMSGAIYAGESIPRDNQPAHNAYLTDNKMLGQNGVEYFTEVLKGGGLYTFLLRMNTEVYDVAKTVEYVALFHELNSANRILSQILIELKKNNQLLSQNKLNKEGAMDG